MIRSRGGAGSSSSLSSPERERGGMGGRSPPPSPPLTGLRGSTASLRRHIVGAGARSRLTVGEAALGVAAVLLAAAFLWREDSARGALVSPDELFTGPLLPANSRCAADAGGVEGSEPPAASAKGASAQPAQPPAEIHVHVAFEHSDVAD
jgi:glycosyltransferase involved in cell wall biosynthesis